MTENGKDGTRSPSADHSAGDQESGDIAKQNGSTEFKTTTNNGENGTTQDAQKPASNNSKDPSRPRRKKARRACFACQRAHLTCGMLLIFTKSLNQPLLFFHAVVMWTSADRYL